MVRLAADIPGRGTDTHLALVRVIDEGTERVAQPLPHAASSMHLHFVGVTRRRKPARCST